MTLDVLVVDPGLGALAAGYLLALRGRSVGLVDRATTSGTTTVSASIARRVEPLRALVEAAPVIARRAVKVLQPEGALGIDLSSARLTDAGDAIVIIDRAAAQAALTGAITDHGGQVIPDDGAIELTIDETGFVVGVRSGADDVASARCSILGDVDLDRVGGVAHAEVSPADWAIESEWRLAIASRQVNARFGLGRRQAAEWWLYGDPLDGASGFGRLRAFGGTIALAVVVPLDQVWTRELSVEGLGDRLRGHPSLSPLLAGGELVAVDGRTLALREPTVVEVVGDGWVAAPRASAADLAPLTTELRMAETLAVAVDVALGSPRVTASRLAGLPGRLRAISASAQMLPLGPIDGWADDLVSSPGHMVEGARLLAERFARAG